MPLISSANARSLAARSAEVRRLRRQASAQEAARLASLRIVPVPSENYAQVRLSRVRAILDTLDGRLSKLAVAGEPKEIRDIAAALAPLSEQECWLSQRPRPGNLRPKATRSQAPASGVGFRLAEPIGLASDPDPAPLTVPGPSQPSLSNSLR